MGKFNDVFRLLCDEAFFMSGQEFALSWNRKLQADQTSIDESTVNRWKDDTLPRQFYLPRIVRLCGALAEERAAAGEGGLGRELRDKIAAAGGVLTKDLAKKADRVFLAGALEAAYLAQKNSRPGAGASPAPPSRGRTTRWAVIALAAGGAALVVTAVALIVFLSRPRAAVPRPADDPAASPVTVGPIQPSAFMKAVTEGDRAAARRYLAAGGSVDATAYRQGGRLDLLRAACDGPPSDPPASGRLEDGASAWGVWWGDKLPAFAFAQAAAPGGEGRALRLSFLGGEPYAFAHFYLNLKPRRDADRFRVTLRLYLDGEAASGGAGGSSPAQALEVSVSKFEGKRRYELAWQWENAGEGAPQWRYWDPARGWTAAGLPLKLAPRTWHELQFTGRAAGSAVSYDTLSVDGTACEVGRTAGAAALSEPLDYLAAAVQLDGNAAADPYEIYVKDFRLETTE